MATLVLSAVGTAVGGPIGGAIGALIGQSVDRRVLGPKRREGPRLTELAVQTSRYGAQIPRLFGRMRVAGSVIWATDLIEMRGTSGGAKGQPGTTRYSYAASFAVLLSARAISGVGRIWADGTLLRGAAGDMKVAGGFRLYRGGETQGVDPLIASAEGAAAPAHRGCAYAVFEGLALADYGNRIPSLTFEVIADDGPVGVGKIARAVADTVVGDVPFAVDGFAVAGGSVGAVLDTLAQASGAVFALEGTRLLLRDDALGDGVAGGGVVPQLADAGVSADGAARPGTRAMTPADRVPQSVVVSHYDPARDYQAGVQRARRPGAGLREHEVEVPAALSASAAKAVAQAILARAEAQRHSRILSIGPAALAIAPGSIVTIAGETGRWRVRTATIERMAGRVELVPAGSVMTPATASSGRVLPTPDAAIGSTMLAVFETLPLDDSVLAMPRLSVVAAGGPGWRRATLLYSLDEGASWTEGGVTALPGVIGRVTAVAGDGSAVLDDPAATMVVTLAGNHMLLEDGGQVALVGDELIQIGRAVPEGGNRWRLEMLARGVRGTETAIGTQEVGAPFVLLTRDTVRGIDLSPSMIGRSVRVMATGVGDRYGPVTVALTVSGASVLPPAPAQLTAVWQDDGSVVVRWVRRSRAGWAWIDGVDVPLVEEREAYVVTIAAADRILRTAESAVPEFLLSPVDIAAGAVSVAVAQRGTMGLSQAAQVMIAAITV